MNKIEYISNFKPEQNQRILSGLGFKFKYFNKFGNCTITTNVPPDNYCKMTFDMPLYSKN